MFSLVRLCLRKIDDYKNIPLYDDIKLCCYDWLQDMGI